MAACRSLQHMFENPLPESPTTLLGSLSSSWNQIKKSTNPIEDHPSSSSSSSSLTDLFGELHFQDNHPHHQPFQPSNLPIIPSSSSPSSSLAHLNPNNSNNERTTAKKPPSSSSSDYYYHKNSDSFSSMNSESLQLCTESLGFESSDDVEDLSNNDCWRQGQEERISITRHNTTTTPHHENHHLGSDFRRSRMGSGRTFPPPISSIGQSGKPWVCFKSYRSNGRFILKEIRVPTREFLHACREDGRLKLQFVQSDDETLDEEDGKEEEEEEEEEEISDDNQEDGDRNN